MTEPFFSLRKLPQDWETVLTKWVTGTALSETLNGRKAVEVQRTQAFIQDGVVFRLVWAAEAARVQAIATDHGRKSELGDAPAFVFTYGVPSIPAALLCQMGYASRTGALWLTQQLPASFNDFGGLREWLRENDAFLEDQEFWQSEDQFLMWKHAIRPSGEEYPVRWNHSLHNIPVNWTTERSESGSLTRIIAGRGRSATVCSADLAPLGIAQLPFDPHGAALDGRVGATGMVEVHYFGRGG